MGYEVLVDRRVEKDLRKAPPHVVERFLEVLDRLAEDPLTPRPGCDILPLHGGCYRLRIGGWRVFYDVDTRKRIVRVTLARPRPTAYDR